MTDQDQEQAAEAADENPFEDELDEDASEATFFGWIGQKTEGDFVEARRIIDSYMRRLQALEAEMGAITESVDAQIATHEAEAANLRDLRKTPSASEQCPPRSHLWPS